MGSFTNYLENAFLNHLTTNSAYSPAATLYLGLSTSDPGEAATGASANEVANSNGYARTAIAFGAAASRRITQNANTVFPEASGSWGTVSHWFVADSATHGAGNVLAYGAFATPFAVVSGNIRTVASGVIYVEITAGNGITNYAANGFLDRAFRNQAFTVSANFVALVTATPGDTSTGSSITEPSGNNYTREEINEAGGSTPKWGSVSSGAVTNADDVDFNVPSGSWGTITHGVICDASTTGNALFYDDVVSQLVGTETTDINIPAGDLDITMS